MEPFFDLPDCEDDLSANGDDDYVMKIVKRGQEPVPESDELS